jgi:hypothetical protein
MVIQPAFVPYGAVHLPLVIFALTHNMDGPTIAEPQDIVFRARA